jgi:hypothetical protein
MPCFDKCHKWYSFQRITLWYGRALFLDFHGLKPLRSRLRLLYSVFGDSCLSGELYSRAIFAHNLCDRGHSARIQRLPTGQGKQAWRKYLTAAPMGWPALALY